MGRWRALAAFDVVFLALSLLAPGAVGTRWWRRQASWRYRRLAPHYDAKIIARTPGYRAPLEAALGRLSPPYGRILDVGTGTGTVALEVARRFPGSCVCACDVSGEMLRVARQRAQGLGLRIAWQQANGTRLPYRNASFDLVLLQNAPPAFAELARVLKPGGTLVLCFTKGGGLPGFLERRLVRRLGALGIPVVELRRVASGLYVLARRSAGS
ncbi:MAG: class I SAM-dependent methyltransferase [Armatimonadota bacterium]|nr:class I SAM-dependent methyltransferase [Armatimonadota bacterium]